MYVFVRLYDWKSDWNAREPKRNGTVINAQNTKSGETEKYATKA